MIIYLPQVGKRWSNVIDKCIKGRHQPLLLLYTNPHADPIATDTAPKYITMMPGYEKVLDNGFIPHHRESKEAPPLIGRFCLCSSLFSEFELEAQER